MSQSVELVLDRPRRFKLTPTDWRDAARRLSAMVDRHITTTALLSLVVSGDYDALSCVLWAGGKHEDDRLTTDKMMAVIDARLQSGGDFEDITDAILACLRSAGILRRPTSAETEGNPPMAEKPSLT